LRRSISTADQPPARGSILSSSTGLPLLVLARPRRGEAENNRLGRRDGTLGKGLIARHARDWPQSVQRPLPDASPPLMVLAAGAPRDHFFVALLGVALGDLGVALGRRLTLGQMKRRLGGTRRLWGRPSPGGKGGAMGHHRRDDR
jgi:hypothetical protein